MAAKILHGTPLAKQITSEVADSVKEMESNHKVTPGLAVIKVGDDPASSIYVRNKLRAANETGINAKSIDIPSESTEKELLKIVARLNHDKQIHGVIIQLPLPNHIDENTIIDALDPQKDVDGLHPANIGLLVTGRPRFISATPAGIHQILIHNGFDPTGQHVVICGRSNIVGKPLVNLLMQRTSGANATVTLCHTQTKGLKSITTQADILIAAIGKPNFITSDMVKEGAVVIDVGINRQVDNSKKHGYRIVGDVDYNQVSKKAKAITPVPGGIGPMTIAMLLHNTVRAARFSIHPHSIP